MHGASSFCPAPRARRAAAAPPHRQRGLGLLETLFLVLLVGGLLLAAFVYMRAQAPRQQAEAQAAALAWADHALIGFAAANARLPCPATQPDGPEDCSGNAAKGWLPVASLSLVAANPGPGTLPMGYVAYRGAGGSDLLRLTDQFNPHGWDGSPYATFGALNGLDFCVALDLARGNPASSMQAYFLGPSGVVNVAYGIVAASPLGGSGDSLFDGVNIVSGGAQVEAPGRGLTPAYGDRVRVRDFAALSAALNCNHTLASLDGMALAADVLDETASQKDALRTSAILLSTINAIKTTVQLIKVVLAGIALGTAIAMLSAAVAALASAIASCVVLVGCAFIPTATAAVVAAAAGVVAAGTSIALNAGAMVAQAIATAEAIVVAIEAGAAFEDVGTGSLQEAIDAAHDAAIAADQVAVDARNDYNSTVASRDSALASMNEAWTALIGYLGGDNISAGDAERANNARAAIDAYLSAQQRQAAAVSVRKSAESRVSQLAEALIQAQNDYAVKRAACLAETVPSEKQRCEIEMNVAADTVTSILQAQVVAAADLSDARAAEQAANTAVSVAAGERNTAVAALINARGDFLILPIILDVFESRYKDYIGKRDLAANKYDAMLTAEAKAQDAWDGYNTLLAMQIGGGTPGGSEVQIGAGQRDILEAADRRGAVR